jgi:hypothetical protein
MSKALAAVVVVVASNYRPADLWARAAAAAVVATLAYT